MNSLIGTIKHHYASKPSEQGRIRSSLARLSRSLFPVIDCLSPAIDVYASSHPEIAGLVWGSVKLVLMICLILPSMRRLTVSSTKI